MGIGYLVRAVVKFLDRGVVLRYVAFVYLVLDLVLADRSVVVYREFVLRQIIKAPCPVASLRCGGCIFLFSVSFEYHCYALGPDAVFVFRVSPDFDSAYADVLGSMFVGYGSDVVVRYRAYKGVLIGFCGLFPVVIDQRAGRGIVFGQMRLGMAPVACSVEYNDFADGFCACVKLYFNFYRSYSVLVVLVVPNLLNGGLGLLDVDHVVAVNDRDVAVDFIFGDGVYYLDVCVVNDLIYRQIREAPAPVRFRCSNIEFTGVFVVRKQADHNAFGSVRFFAVEPRLFAFDAGDESVSYREACRDAAGRDTYVSGNRVFGHGVFDLFRCAAGTVLGQMFEYVAPVARLKIR